VRNFIYPEDAAVARIGDSQGLGGHNGKIKHREQSAAGE
jgi:hypothetical protein